MPTRIVRKGNLEYLYVDDGIVGVRPVQTAPSHEGAQAPAGPSTPVPPVSPLPLVDNGPLDNYGGF